MSKRLLGWCALCSIVYLWWAVPRLGLPLLTEEVQFAASWDRPLAKVVVGIPHPTAYIGLLRVLVNHGWLHGPFLRVVGMVSFGALIVLVAYLAERLSPGAGPLAALLWTVHPMAIQGSLILEIDNALLTLVVTAYLALLMALPVRLSRGQVVGLGLALAGCLWVKLSCAPFLLLAAALRPWSQRQWALGGRQVLAIAGIAVVVFLGSWRFWCALSGISWVSVFDWVATATHRGLQGEMFGWGTELLNRAGRVGLWLNPWLVVGWLVASWWVGRVPAAERWRWWSLVGFTAVVMIGYLIIRGTHFGFAKYHLPALPAALALVAATAQRAIKPLVARQRIVLGLVGLLGLGYFWGVGDLLYQVNYTLRLALLTGTPPLAAMLRQLLGRSLLYLLPGFVVGGWLLGRWPRGQRAAGVCTGLLLLLLSSNLALDLRQRQAPYATTYTYGRSWGTYQEAVQWVKAFRQAHPNAAIVGPVDILWSAGVLYTEWLSVSLPDSGETILQAIQNPAVGCLLYGTTTHDLRTWRQLLATPQFRKELEQHFTEVTVHQGEYFAWVRRP